MPKFQANKFDINAINGGEKIKDGDGIFPDFINAPIEAAAYAQALATNQPDISELNNSGTPNVSIVETENGTPQFKFSNIRGEKGEKGDKGDMGEIEIVRLI